jgi:hypothetical protein
VLCLINNEWRTIMHAERQPSFKKNEKLEDLLREINRILEVPEAALLQSFSMPRFPVIFIVGCARAGSTIILQWLANTGIFAYPTNLIARFYAAPYIGARIQQMLTDPQYNFRDEFVDLKANISFLSELGKTQGILAPNEFWYFWRRFFHYGEIQRLEEDALQSVDRMKFVSELAALEGAFDKPLMLKAHIINWNIPFIERLFDKVLFIHIIRQPLYNAQSLLESREKFFGGIDTWYSFKPPEYVWLKERNPYEQVAGQVYFTNQAISKGLGQICEERWMSVRYEELCERPASVFSAIKEKYQKQQHRVDWSYDGPETFTCTNRMRLAEEHACMITNAYTNFAQGAGRG